MHLCVAFLAIIVPWQATAQQTLKLSPTLTIEKTDDKQKTYDAIQELQKYAVDKKLQGNVVRFLDNAVAQMKKVMEVQKVVEAKAQETPKVFTSGKYKVKDMPKLRAKKPTVKKITVDALRKQLQSGKTSFKDFKEPQIVMNATSLFKEGDWDIVRRMLNSNQIVADEDTDSVLKDLKLEYFPPDKARARLVGNMLQMEEPQMIPFSRYMTICFLGTPAKPTLPGQNTEHCEQTVNAQTMRNASALEMLNIFPEVKNTFPLQDEFRRALLDAGKSELPAILGKDAKKFINKQGQSHFRFFTFGPSGSGDKLHAENGLPMFDVLVHGSRRWLLMGDQELERVAVKAREALEFDKTSAYMFFEEKLPELIEEFGLKKYVETNQDAGDLMIVPPGWYRVSLALADSISFYETILSDKNIFSQVVDNNIWRPQFRQFQLAYCYKPADIESLPGVKGNTQLNDWLKEAIGKVKSDEAISGILTVMMQCGSVLALDTPLPHLGVTKGLTSCTQEVWTQCRARLQEKLADKKITASLDWLPQAAPLTVKDVPKAKDEL